MDRIVRSLPYVSTYIDDVLIHSRSIRDHKAHLQEVFNRLKEAGLTLQGRKCNIGLTEVKYLGHIFSAKGLRLDPLKVDAIINWPTPKNAEDVCRFLGLASYYRRYVFQFSEVAAPLHNLTCKNVAFEWSPSCEESFSILKSTLVEPPTLAYPQTHSQASPFVLHTDASAHGLGAVLEQVIEWSHMQVAH